MIGKTISHYKILKEIGAGGMGIVYKAEDTDLKRFVALKFLPPGLTRDKKAKDRFIHEAQSASALDHPNICTVHEVGKTDDGQIFIAMVFYEGETLKERISAGPLELNEAVNIAIQVAEGLSKAYEKKIIHRDIKPANIFITKDGFVKILDFGLAKLSGQTKLTKTGGALGTVAYMSPEQTQGTEVDHRTDIWSLGVVLYEMLTGQLPFKGDYEQAIVYSTLNEEYEPIKKIRKDVPENLEKIVKFALQKEPDSRYPSVTNILKDLVQYKQSKLISSTKVRTFKLFLQATRNLRFVVPTILVLFVISIAFVWFLNRKAKIQWAKEQALPEITQQIESNMNTAGWGNFEQAFKLANEANKYIPNDSVLIRLWPQFTSFTSIITAPSGADIYRKEYSSIESEWEYLGKSPIDSIKVPHVYSRWKIEKEGYVTIIAASLPYLKLSFKLDSKVDIPSGMIRVQGGNSAVGTLNDFFIDRYEVTNKQFKEFIDSGGYEKENYWKHKFVKNGKEFTWKDAMLEFCDATGQAGPAFWEVGDYPDDQDDYPVSGVSWYEAAAFAEFKGKKLPTVYHWKLASRGIPSKTILLSNFNSTSPTRVGSSKSISMYGAYDMAGNVREWCLNESKNGHFIMGSSWNEADYLFLTENVQPAFNRSVQNGFRCAIYQELEEIPKDAFEYKEMDKSRDYRLEKPVSDAIFQTYKQQFDYYPIELKPEIEWTDSSSVDWIKQKITFNAAYNNERVIVYLYLPKGIIPPYQTIVYFPGGMPGTGARRFIADARNFFDNRAFLVKSGRAMMFPIYKETLERYEGIEHFSTNSVIYKEHMIMWVQDFKKSIDYLETREDIDLAKLAFWGNSLGARMGTLITAVEDRLKAGIFSLGGFDRYYYRSEVDPLNYVSRITIPVLLLNGKYDPLRPFDLCVEPYVALLASKNTEFRHCIYDTEHNLPKNELMKESINWLNQYLGPVK